MQLVEADSQNSDETRSKNYAEPSVGKATQPEQGKCYQDYYEEQLTFDLMSDDEYRKWGRSN